MRFAALAGFPLVETQRNQLSSANILIHGWKTWMAVLTIVLPLWSGPAFAQKMVFDPTRGQAGTKVCVTGSGWAEPSPVCYYRFYFNNNQVVFPDQPDGQTDG